MERTAAERKAAKKFAMAKCEKRIFFGLYHHTAGFIRAAKPAEIEAGEKSEGGSGLFAIEGIGPCFIEAEELPKGRMCGGPHGSYWAERTEW